MFRLACYLSFVAIMLPLGIGTVFLLGGEVAVRNSKPVQGNGQGCWRICLKRCHLAWETVVPDSQGESDRFPLTRRMAMLDLLAGGGGGNNRGVRGVPVERLVPVRSQSVSVRQRTWSRKLARRE